VILAGKNRHLVIGSTTLSRRRLYRLKHLTRHRQTRLRVLLWAMCSALMSGLFLNLAIRQGSHFPTLQAHHPM
jgi:hypothetical protein